MITILERGRRVRKNPKIDYVILEQPLIYLVLHLFAKEYAETCLSSGTHLGSQNVEEAKTE